MKALLSALALLPALAFAQTTEPALAASPPTVSLDARGTDVREALATLFAQAKKPYALDAAIKGTLYMRFEALPFDKALDIVMRQAGLVAKEENGVLLVSLAAPIPATEKPKPAPPPKKPAPSEILLRRVTVHLARTPIREVLASLGKQANVGIDLDGVPAYRLDADFKNVPLKTALDGLCGPTKLRYAFAGGKFRVSKAVPAKGT